MTIHNLFDFEGIEKVHDHLEDLIFRASEALQPSEPIDVATAASRYRNMNNPGGKQGLWSNERTPYLVEPMRELTNKRFEGVAFMGPAQCGKALALDTPIPTPSGWTTMGALKVGDKVIGRDGKPCNVTFATEVQFQRRCYEVTFSNGDKVTADADHNWMVYDGANGGQERVKTTAELVAHGVSYRAKSRLRWQIPAATALELPSAVLPVDPYVMGAWLGDGHAYGMRMYAHVDDAANMLSNLRAAGISPRMHEDKKGLAVIALTPFRHTSGRAGGRHPISEAFHQCGLGSGRPKTIPAAYLRGSIEQRQALLAGLMDTDGSVSIAGRCTFSTSEDAMKAPFAELLNSLGYRFKYRDRLTRVAVAREFAFSPRTGETIFRLKRKQARLDTLQMTRKEAIHDRVLIKEIREVESVPVRCITVDGPDHLYAFGEGMAFTHNTDMFLNYQTYLIRCDPADLTLVQTTNTTARDFSVARIARMHRANEWMSTRCVKDNVFDKQYDNGMIVRMSWPTSNELSGKPIPRMWITDYDRMDMDVDGEGTPWSLARARTTSFRSFGKVIVESSPGKEYLDPQWQRNPARPHEAPPAEGIGSVFNSGDRRRYYWRCVNPRCRQAFEPAWNLIQYPNTRDPIEAGEAATMHCPFCAHRYTHDPSPGSPGKMEMIQLAENGGHARWLREGELWLPDGTITGEARRAKIASFALEGVCAAFSTWAQLVTDYVTAEQEFEMTGKEDTLKTVVNTKIGRHYLPKAQAKMRLAENLRKRAINWPRRTVPPGVRYLLATVDVQSNRFEVQIHGISIDDIYVIDRFAVKYSKRPDPANPTQFLPIDPKARPEDWRHLLFDVIQKSYPLSTDSNKHMAIHHTVCDSGGADGVTANAYDFYRWLVKGYDEEATDEIKSLYPWVPGFAERFKLLKPDPIMSAPTYALRYPDSQRKDRLAGARGEIPVIFLNVNAIKNKLDNMLEREDEGGTIIFPDWLDLGFFRELTVETKNKEGRWENISGRRNESWDLLVYCLGSMRHSAVKHDAINWDNPPDYAKEWSRNSLIFSLTEDKTPFEQPSDPYDELAALGEEMA